MVFDNDRKRIILIGDAHEGLGDELKAQATVDTNQLIKNFLKDFTGIAWRRM